MAPDLSALASRCSILEQARALAAWVGDGKPLTAKGVLRPADARVAAKHAGITVPAHIRSAADIPSLHYPWLVAEATGMLTIDGSRAVAAPTSDRGEPLSLWLAGLDAVLRAESRDQPRRYGAEVLCRILLGLLDADPPPARDKLPHSAYQLLDHYQDPIEADAAFQAFDRSVDRVEDAVSVLAAFDAVDDRGRTTPLGQWARDQLEARVPPPVTIDLPANELLARLTGLTADQVRHRTRVWLRGRGAAEAADALLQAADAASPAGRMLALELVAMFSDDPTPYWQRALSLPNVAPHARSMLVIPESGYEGLDEADRCWLATEYVAASFATYGVDDAYYELLERGGTTILDRGGHPDAELVRQALDDHLAVGGGKTHIYQLKIELSRLRSAVWRRVLTPAGSNLGALHQIIRVLYGWGDDHLHAFTSADGARYSDPFYDLEECGDEHEARLSRLLPRAETTMTYVYDFGDWWEHRITLERVLDPDPALTYPTCVNGRGDARWRTGTPSIPPIQRPSTGPTSTAGSPLSPYPSRRSAGRAPASGQSVDPLPRPSWFMNSSWSKYR